VHVNNILTVIFVISISDLVKGNVFQKRLRIKEPSIQWVSGALFPGVKPSRREADNSPASSADVKNEELYLHPHTSSWHSA
jgi:hypothetical protein